MTRYLNTEVSLPQFSLPFLLARPAWLNALWRANGDVVHLLVILPRVRGWCARSVQNRVQFRNRAPTRARNMESMDETRVHWPGLREVMVLSSGRSFASCLREQPAGDAVDGRVTPNQASVLYLVLDNLGSCLENAVVDAGVQVEGRGRMYLRGGRSVRRGRGGS